MPDIKEIKKFNEYLTSFGSEQEILEERGEEIEEISPPETKLSDDLAELLGTEETTTKLENAFDTEEKIEPSTEEVLSEDTDVIPEKAEGVNAHVSYDITGDGGGQWTLIVNHGTCEIRSGPDPTAKSHAKMTAKTYLKLAQGKLDGRVAFMLGKIKIKGDKTSLATVRECFRVPEL